MLAILWDGNKQIHGSLMLGSKKISFKLKDFSETDLEFDLAYNKIKEIQYHSLYSKIVKGIKIVSDSGKSNVFIVEKPELLKKSIESKFENSY